MISNFQTVKPRAFKASSGVYVVYHPITRHAMVARYPHDTAKQLLENYVLRTLIAPRVE
jgi:hypothetical protein